MVFVTLVDPCDTSRRMRLDACHSASLGRFQRETVERESEGDKEYSVEAASSGGSMLIAIDFVGG